MTTVLPRPADTAGDVTVPEPPGSTPPAAEVRRRLGGGRPADNYAVIGAAVSAVSLATMIYYMFTPWSGLQGYVVVTWLLFLGSYSVLLSIDNRRLLIEDRIVAVLVTSVAAFIFITLIVIVGFTFFRGFRAMSYWRNFFSEDLIYAGPLDPLNVGGIAHGIVGTLIQITIVLIVIIPLGIITAVFLSEQRGPFPRFVRTVIEAMTALPSIIAGLFVYAIILTTLDVFGFGGRNGFAASMALSIMALPIVIRAADVVLRLVPGTLKEAAAATGAPRWRILWHVTLPTARSGLLTAVILGTARAIGETSPVLLTSGITTNFNVNPFNGSMVSLPLLTFNLTKSPEPGFISRGFGAAATLMILVLVLFALARWLGGRAPGDVSRGQARRRGRRSLDDLRRIEARPDGSPAGSAPQRVGVGVR